MTEPSAAVLDEQALLQGLRDHRPEAFESLVRAYTPGCWPWRGACWAATKTRATWCRTAS